MKGTVYKFLPPYTRENFTKYLLRVFGMYGSASLAKQLKPVEFSGIRHVLVNPANENLSPWYSMNDNKMIQTPEYLFYTNELKCW